MSCGRRQPVQVARRSPAEIQTAGHAGHIVAETLQLLRSHIRPGITTIELDKLAEAHIRARGALPSFKGYKGYPATICVEIEDVVVHGIPDSTRLSAGQLVGIDLGACYQGFHGDSAVTVPVGEVDEERQRLLQITEQALWAGIEQARAGHELCAVCHAVQQCVESAGFSVVRSLVGHGIGHQMHEPPQIPNFVSAGEFKDYELVLEPGMILAIEPMVNIGTAEVCADDDGWTVHTADGRPSAHFEHTVAVTEREALILTEVTSPLSSANLGGS